MSSHEESCAARLSAHNTMITDMPAFSASPSQRKLPQSVKTQMANDVVTMCATNIRPFSIVDGRGFQAVAQKLIAVGAKYGNLLVDDVLPSSTTVLRHLQTVVAAQKTELREKLLSAASFGITTDRWIHTVTNQHNITTTVHFIDVEWNVQSYILATRLADEKHTMHYIRNFVGEILEEFGVKK